MVQAIDESISPTPIPTPLNVTALARRHRVARSTIQRRLKKGWVPPTEAPRKPRRTAARATADAAPNAAPAIAPVLHQRVLQEVRRPSGRTVGSVLVGTGFAIAGLAIGINAQAGCTSAPRAAE